MLLGNIKYEDVFSTDSADIGLTQLVTIDVYKGDSPSMRRQVLFYEVFHSGPVM